MQDYLKIINERIDALVNDSVPEAELLQKSMKYSMSAGGKRIRPTLVLEFCRLCCDEPEKALNFAVALECIHTASLIHDDLPCMDNDDFRRGKPTNHKIFGEAVAVCAGDALITLAFRLAATSVAGHELPEKVLIEGVRVLADATGYKGMIGGQVIDLISEGKIIDNETLELLHSMKTGALIRAAALLGCIAGGADAEKTAAAVKYAENIGLAFQIVDDILDVEGDAEKLGKTLGKDSESGKSTFVSNLGIISAKNIAKELTMEAAAGLSVFEQPDYLQNLASELLTRDH